MLNTGAGLTRQVALNHISRAHDKLLLRLISVCGGGREQLTNPSNLGWTSHLAPMSHGRRSPPPGQGSGAAGRRGPRSACPGPAGGGTWEPSPPPLGAPRPPARLPAAASSSPGDSGSCGAAMGRSEATAAVGSQREERAAPADVPGTAAPPPRPLPAAAPTGAPPQVGPGAGPRLALRGEGGRKRVLAPALPAGVGSVSAGSPLSQREVPLSRRDNSSGREVLH